MNLAHEPSALSYFIVGPRRSVTHIRKLMRSRMRELGVTFGEKAKNKHFNKAFLMAASCCYLDIQTVHQRGKVTCPKHMGNWA